MNQRAARLLLMSTFVSAVVGVGIGVRSYVDRAPVAPASSARAMVPAPERAARYVRLFLSESQTCALDDAGDAACWGVPVWGITDRAPWVEARAPIPIPLPARQVVEVALLEGRTCVLDDAAMLSCVGQEDLSRFGIEDVISVGVAPIQACVVLRNGRASCWMNAQAKKIVPVDVAGSRDLIQVAVGSWHACAIRRDHKVVCWGLNSLGELGDGTLEDRAVPVEVSGLSDVEQLSVGTGFTCARSKTGAVDCWGYNEYQQLGKGPEKVLSPTRWHNVDDAIDVAAGDRHVCVLSRAGATLCAGSNEADQLGRGQVTGEESDAMPVLGLPHVATLAAGRARTCAIDHEGAIWCWGALAHLTRSARSAVRIFPLKAGERPPLPGACVDPGRDVLIRADSLDDQEWPHSERDEQFDLDGDGMIDLDVLSHAGERELYVMRGACGHWVGQVAGFSSSVVRSNQPGLRDVLTFGWCGDLCDVSVDDKEYHFDGAVYRLAKSTPRACRPCAADE